MHTVNTTGYPPEIPRETPGGNPLHIKEETMKTIREYFIESGVDTAVLDRNPARERILDGQLARLERIGWKHWGISFGRTRKDGRELAAEIWFT